MIPSDRVGVALAALLAIAPLLPTGLTYAGLPPFAYVELVVPALFLVWMVVRFQTRRYVPSTERVSLLAWHVTIAVVMGASVFGLMAENRVDSPVFGVWLREAAGVLFLPMNQAVHPLYPLRVALTFAEGWIVWLLVVDLCRRAPDPHRRAQIALAGWFLGLVLVAAFALVQYVTRFQLHPYWVRANPAITRAHSTLDDPNTLGAYMALGIGMVVGLLLLGPVRRRLWWSAVFVAGVVGLATTMSRSAMGAALVATLGAIAIRPQPVTRWQRLVRTAGRVLVAALAMGVLGSTALRMVTTEERRTQPDSQVQLMVTTFDPRESTDWVLRGRLAWWGAAAAMFREHVMTGVGLGRFPRLMETYGGGRWKENTHNLFLQMLAEAGIAGAAFAGLCVSLCVLFVRRLRRSADPPGRAMALGGLIACLAFTMTLVTGHALLLPSGQILWASLAAIAAVGSAAPFNREASTGRTGAGVLTAVGLLTIVLWYPVAAVLQGVTPRGGEWGYAWGLYPEERTSDGVGYRWTAGRALLEVTVPPGATTLQLPVAAPTPLRNGSITTVRITAGRSVREVAFAKADVQTIDVPLVEPDARAGGRALVEVVVFPTFTPGGAGPSADDRVLGVQLLRPRFTDGHRPLR